MLLDINEITRILPHRYPFLLVDRVLECDPGKRIVALKNVTMNEPFFEGHFPGHPVMPGVLIVEAMAQAGGLLIGHSTGGTGKEKIFYFAGIENAKFRRPVTPGDQLRFEIDVVSSRRGIWEFAAGAYIEGKLAAEAKLKLAYVSAAI